MTQDRHTDPVAIGVVIPARDEAARIDRCLTAVMASVRGKANHEAIGISIGQIS